MRPISVLVVTLGFCGSALGTSSSAQSEDAIAKQFVGIWRLVTWQQRLADGTTRQDPRTVSYIIYTDTGHMCWVAMNPNRPMWKSANPTPEEALSSISGLGAYCSTVEIHAREGFVLHHIEIERSPSQVGRTRKRWFTSEGPNRVLLRIDPSELGANFSELGPPVVESVLTWERVQKK